MAKEFEDECSISNSSGMETVAVVEPRVEEHHQWDKLELYAKNIKDRWRSG